MLVTMGEILNRAKAGGYAVIAPNVNNEDTARAAIEVAVEYNTPVILDVLYQATPDIVLLGRIIEYMAKNAAVPVAVNLDHGADQEKTFMAVRAGFTSVMIDKSKLSYEENVAETAAVVKVAHGVGISVEAELGFVGNAANYEDDRDKQLTSPEEAVDFVKKTCVDALAVAIGTAHGLYSGTPHLDFPRLEELRKAVDVPLVLHGGSGTGDENLSRAAQCGIAKINIGTDLYVAGYKKMNEAMTESFAGGKRVPPSVGMIPIFLEGYKEELRHYIQLTGQIGKAW